MSLSAQLRDPESIVNVFLNDQLPQRQDVIDEWSTELGEVENVGHGLRPSVASGVGMAFELRVGLDLGRQASEFPTLQYLPPEYFKKLVEAAGYVLVEPKAPFYVMPEGTDPLMADWRKKHEPFGIASKEPMSELSLLAAQMHYSSREDVRRAVEYKRAYWELTLDPEYGGHDDRDTDKSVGALDTLWATYQQQGRSQFLRYGERAIISPDIAVGFALADLVMNHVVIDIKAQSRPQQTLGKTFDQVLMYALLDRHDVFNLQKVAVYFGWQGRMVDSGLDEIIATSTKGSTVSLQDLREDIAERLSVDLGGSYRSHARKKLGFKELGDYAPR